FHTVTITAAYLTIVECAVLVMLLSKMAKSKKLKDYWKELVLFGVVSSYIVFTMARTAFFAVAATLVFAVIFMAAGKGMEKVKNMGRIVGMMILAVVVCLPVTFTMQRTIPALYSDPYMYEIEDFTEDAKRGRKLDSVEFMRVGRFIDVFAEKIFNIPEGTFDIYGEIAAYNEEHGIETSEISSVSDEVIGVEPEGKLVASADYVPEAESEEDDDYTNGRLDIFRSYIEQLNMTGHEGMGAILEDGETAVHAHNIYLQVAYDHGIPTGILFLLVGIVTFVRACLYYVKKKETIAYAALPAVITVAVAVAGVVEWIFHISNPCGLALLLVITPFFFREE
ncbi:MAG: O-antigen ligase family protein, partial [Lachnospiraceae bacterium]|nr:O-antigen ligase family protein [Lachnospiraceae bacterium]